MRFEEEKMAGRSLIYAVLAMLSVGCASGVKTADIRFYNLARTSGPIAVDVVYLDSPQQRDSILDEFSPDPSRWFRSERRNGMNLINEDVQPGAGPTSKPLTNKKSSGVWPFKKYTPFVLVIAEYGPRAGALGPNQFAIGSLDENSIPKPKGREHIAVYDGFMERLPGPPSAGYIRR
jgi:hypothetical protein